MSHDDAEILTPAYLWFDTEFTSLDLEEAALLQVALLATDRNLARLGPPEADLNLYVEAPPEERLSPWVRENLGHVLAHCRGAAAIPAGAVDAALCAAVDGLVGPPDPDIRRRPVIAGNSVHADVMLARRLLPGFLSRCHYRLLDVSTLKILWVDGERGEAFDKDDPAAVRAEWPGAVLPASELAHDAYYDVQASVAELAYYRRAWLADGPGAGAVG